MENKITVIVADDHKTMRDLLSNILINAGCDVIAQAENGLIAVDLYERHKPDIILLDIDMPAMNGIEALKMIHEMDESAFVVMVSGEGTVDVVKESISQGALGFIVKPFTADRINGILNKYKKQINT